MHQCCHRFALNTTVTCTYRDGTIKDHVLILNEQVNADTPEISNVKLTKSCLDNEPWSEEEYLPQKKQKC